MLIACEESQAVCKAFREIGIEAYSCDIQECSGGHPEWHIMGDVLPLLNGKCKFNTCDGQEHEIEGKWDLIIAHPPPVRTWQLAVLLILRRKDKMEDRKRLLNFLCNL